MKKRDVLLLLTVAVVWGVNFTVIKIGLQSVPPLFLVFLRYLFVAFPLIFFVKSPDVSWRVIAGYGLCVSGWGNFRFCSVRFVPECLQDWPLWSCRLKPSSPLSCRRGSWGREWEGFRLPE